MSANFHPLVYIIDYVMGVIMWTLIGRVAMNIFQRQDSEFFFMKVFVKMTDPFIKMFRFYLMHYLLGYSVMGMLSFPLESEIASQIYQIFGKN